MKHFLIGAFSLALFLLVTAQVTACTCSEHDVPPCAAFARSEAVFVGEVIDITLPNGTPPNATVLLRVEERFKGVTGAQIAIAARFGTSCDIGFVKGIRYLVYASRELGQLFANVCSRTNELRYATADLTYLRTVTTKGAQEMISGRLVRSRHQPLPGRKVTVFSDGKELETLTDEKGGFSIVVPGPGKYTVRTSVPFAADLLAYHNVTVRVDATDTRTTLEYEVTVEKNQCNYQQLDTWKTDLHATATISGVVLTPAGRPSRKGFVHLIDAADQRSSQFSLLENGRFSFERIPVGEYYIVINPWNAPPGTQEIASIRTYYPRATEPESAAKIKITEGLKLENLTFRLSSPLNPRSVSGTVRLKDGTVAKAAHIALYAGEKYLETIKVDDKGKFSFTVYGDFDYAIVAEGQMYQRSERVKIGNARPVKLNLIVR